MKGFSTIELLLIVIMFIAVGFSVILLLMSFWPQIVGESSKTVGIVAQNFPSFG